MHLVNFPEIRVKKYPQGYVVEIQVRKWWGKKQWRHISSVSGMPDQPWHYKTKEAAINNVINIIEFNLINN